MRYLEEIGQSENKCNRVIGHQKLHSIGLQIASPLYVSTHQTFLSYKKTHQFSKTCIDEIRLAFRTIRKENSTQGVYAGRAYYVPSYENPPGPRSSSVTDEKIIIQEIKKLFDFAIQNKFDEFGAQIGTILHPFISPKVPYGGGGMTPSPNGKTQVIIETIYGVDEGIQTLPHDSYIVDYEKGCILQKTIVIKKTCLETTSQLTISKVSVPLHVQKVAVLSNQDIVQLARAFKNFVTIFGPHRLEFASQPEGIYFLECVPFRPVMSPKGMEAKGQVKTICSVEDIPTVTPFDKIIYIDPKVIQRRNMDVITTLAFSLPSKRIILYPGSASTAHAATILREKGHILVFIKQELFRSEDHVEVTVKHGEMAVKRL